MPAPSPSPTRQPTPQSTPNPTEAPVPPVAQPTFVPTPLPTPSPTPQPSRKPTVQPSPAPTLKPSPSPTLKPSSQTTEAPVEQLEKPIRINAGGAAFRDSRGRSWQADKYFNSGEAFENIVEISGTEDEELYFTERYDDDLENAPELIYNIPGESGLVLYASISFLGSFAHLSYALLHCRSQCRTEATW